MISLVRQRVVVIKLVWIEQGQILVPPRRSLNVRRGLHQRLLKRYIRGLIGVLGQSRQECSSRHKLIAITASEGHSLAGCDGVLCGGTTRHPLARFLAAIESILEG